MMIMVNRTDVIFPSMWWNMAYTDQELTDIIGKEKYNSREGEEMREKKTPQSSMIYLE